MRSESLGTKVPGLYCRWIFPQENSLFATNPHFWRSFASAEAVSNNCKISWFLSCTACRIGGPPGSQALGSSPERLRDSLWMSIICNCQICNIFGDCVVVVIVLVAKYSSYFSCYSYCSCYFYYSHYSDYSCQSWYSYSYCLLLFYVPLMLFPMFLPITRLLLRLILLLVLIAATVVIFVPVGVSASVGIFEIGPVVTLCIPKLIPPSFQWLGDHPWFQHLLSATKYFT